jgi:hypothetical protein
MISGIRLVPRSGRSVIAGWWGVSDNRLVDPSRLPSPLRVGVVGSISAACVPFAPFDQDPGWLDARVRQSHEATEQKGAGQAPVLLTDLLTRPGWTRETRRDAGDGGRPCCLVSEIHQHTRDQ